METTAAAAPDYSFIQDILVFLLAAIFTVPLSKRLKSSPVLGYMLAGVLIGPHALGIIQYPESAKVLAELGVMFLLFTIGLELSWDRLKSMRRMVLGLGGWQLLVTAAVIGGAMLWLGYSLPVAFVVGFGLALSSTAFVIQLLQEQNDFGKTHGRASFGILLMQDIAIAPLLAVIPLLAQSETGQNAQMWQAVGAFVVQALLVLVVLIALGRLIMRPLYGFISRTQNEEALTATTLVVLLGTGWVAGMAGLSKALGAFLAGVLLADTEYSHKAGMDMRQLRGMLLALFFMTVGMSVDLLYVWQQLWLVLGATLALLALKAVLVLGLSRLYKLHMRDAIRTALTVAQGGEFGIVLFGMALTYGVMPGELAQMLTAIIALSMAVTPLMVYAGKRIAQDVYGETDRALMRLEKAADNIDTHALIVGMGYGGEIIARTLEELKVPYIALDNDAQRVGFLRRQKMNVYFGDATRENIVHAAGSDDLNVIFVAIPQPAAAMAVIRNIRNQCPVTPIIAAAKNVARREEMLAAGANDVLIQTPELNLQMARSGLLRLGHDKNKIRHTIEKLREQLTILPQEKEL